MNQHDMPPAWISEPEPGTRADKFKANLCHVSHIVARTDSPYLVKHWLAPGCASVAFGPSNVGKSFWALDLGMHVAADHDYHGRRVNGGPVIFAALEGGQGFANRIEAVRQNNPDLVKDAEFHLMTEPINLADLTDANALVDAIANLSPVLIVIDTLARAMQGDENSTQDMGRLVRGIDLIRQQTKAHVMLIHHSGKDTSKGARELIIAADGDEPGKIAANSLASRATALGWQVSILPAPDGQDWNDVLQGEVLA